MKKALRVLYIAVLICVILAAVFVVVRNPGPARHLNTTAAYSSTGYAVDMPSARPTVKPTITVTPTPAAVRSYVLNTNTKKFHKPSCSSVDQMKDKNRRDYTGTRESVINMGYKPCQRCNP